MHITLLVAGYWLLVPMLQRGNAYHISVYGYRFTVKVPKVVESLCSNDFIKLRSEATTTFIIRCWTFDVRRSSFFSPLYAFPCLAPRHAQESPALLKNRSYILSSAPNDRP